MITDKRMEKEFEAWLNTMTTKKDAMRSVYTYEHLLNAFEAGHSLGLKAGVDALLEEIELIEEDKGPHISERHLGFINGNNHRLQLTKAWLKERAAEKVRMR